MRLTDLIRGLGLDLRSACADDPDIASITEDSRCVAEGALFIARPGAKADGRDFIIDAITAGAAAILTDRQTATALTTDRHVLSAADVPLAAARLAERFHGDPSRTLDLVGVTGTNGKTTVTHLVRQILNAAGVPCGLIGTVGIAVDDADAPATMTTPGAIELSRLLAQMKTAGRRAAALEVSSHALHQRRAAGLRFKVAVFTNLSGDHLDYHGTMESYADAKAMLFKSLPPESIAIANADDPASQRMLAECAAPALLCSLNESESVESPGRCFVSQAEFTIDGLRADLVGPWGAVTASVPLIGRHNAMNLLQAVAACHALGLTCAQLQNALPSATTPRGRMEPVTAPGAANGPRVFVDYAHTDDALAKALDGLRPLLPEGGRLIVVFGCGGDRDRTKRPRMGRAVAERAHIAHITSDNPRTEDPESIIDEVLAGVTEAHPVELRRNADRGAAITAAIHEATPRDVVVIAGKGHEDYQILPDGKGGTISRHFDDREAAAQALASRTDEPDNHGATKKVYAT